MINAQLSLIVPVFKPEHNSYKLLSTKDYTIEYPSLNIEPVSSSEYSVDINAMITMILGRYFKDVLNVAPKLTDIEILNNNLMIYYLCFINYETTITNGVLTNIDVNNHTFPTNAAKIISLLSKK